MAGGYFTAPNKVIPGAYINFTTTASLNITAGDRGIGTMPISLSWGPKKQFLLVDADTDFKTVFGYDILDPALILIKEALKRAKYLLIYIINDGTAATKTVGSLTVTARQKGTRGNNLTVAIVADVDVPGSFIVTTYLDGEAVASESGANIEDLSGNDFVVFSGEGALVASAGIILADGTDTAAVSADYTTYFTALEVQDFNVIGLPITDATVKAAAANFVKRMIENEGKKIQVVMPSYNTADHEGVISVENGVILSDGTTIDKTAAVAWVMGATAAAAINQDLTFSAYEDAVDVTDRYSNTQIESMLNAGKFFFIPKAFTSGITKIVVQEDINTFTSFTVEKGKEFRWNRSIRTMFDIGTTVPQLWEEYYIGKVDANEDGLAGFKGTLLSYFGNLQRIRAIKNFVEDDISLNLNNDEDVIAELGVQVVKAMKKLYMLVKLK